MPWLWIIVLASACVAWSMWTGGALVYLIYPGSPFRHGPIIQKVGLAVSFLIFVAIPTIPVYAALNQTLAAVGDKTGLTLVALWIMGFGFVFFTAEGILFFAKVAKKHSPTITPKAE